MRDEYFIGVFKVPYGETHRLSRGWYIELATGHPREHDITRYEDNYGRGKNFSSDSIDTSGGTSTGEGLIVGPDIPALRVVS